VILAHAREPDGSVLRQVLVKRDPVGWKSSVLDWNSLVRDIDYTAKWTFMFG